MVSKEMWALGANRSVIRDLFEYGLQQAKIVGPENVFDYSLGNPSIPSPPQVNETVVELLRDMDSIQVHGYTSATGDWETRRAIAEDLNCRYAAGIRPENLFICCGAAPDSSPLCVPWRCRRSRNLWPLPPSSRSISPLPRQRGESWWWFRRIRSGSKSVWRRWRRL